MSKVKIELKDARHLTTIRPLKKDEYYSYVSSSDSIGIIRKNEQGYIPLNVTTQSGLERRKKMQLVLEANQVFHPELTEMELLKIEVSTL